MSSSANSTDTGDPIDKTNTGPTTSDGGFKSVSPTAAAWVLGGLSLVLLIIVFVVFLGFRRSRSHPEMYAPRAATATQPAQSRARGLARAVLDSFPTFTWSEAANRAERNTRDDLQLASTEDKQPVNGDVERDIEGQIANRAEEEGEEEKKEKGLENEDQEASVQLDESDTATLSRRPSQNEESDDVSSAARSSCNENQGFTADLAPHRHGAEDTNHDVPTQPFAADVPLVTSPSPDCRFEREHQPPPAIELTAAEPHGELMESIADPGDNDHDVEDRASTSSLCPICTDDFQDGDTVRVLPCAGRHHYHAACIDEWLTDHSICPLCRFDFAKDSVETQPTSSDDNSAHENGSQDAIAVASGATEDSSDGGVEEEGISLPSNDNTPASATATDTDAPVPRRWSALSSLLRPPSTHRTGHPSTPGSHIAAFRDYCSRKKAQRRERRASSSSPGTSYHPSPSSTSRPTSPAQSHADAPSVDTPIGSRERRVASYLQPHTSAPSRTRSLRIGVGRSGGAGPDTLASRPRSFGTRTSVEDRRSGLYDIDDLQRHVSDAHGLLWLL